MSPLKGLLDLRLQGWSFHERYSPKSLSLSPKVAHPAKGESEQSTWFGPSSERGMKQVVESVDDVARVRK